MRIADVYHDKMTEYLRANTSRWKKTHLQLTKESNSIIENNLIGYRPKSKKFLAAT